MERFHFFAVAIKFGINHYSYCVYSRSDFKSSQIRIIRPSRSSSDGIFRCKSSSCILFRPDQTFHSFGFDAEEKYKELTAGNEHNTWYFFKQPTKMLYDTKDVDRSSTIFDETNKPLQAIKVYTSAIKYLKDEIMKWFKGSISWLTIERIKWVFPVSDIWDGAAKQLFREAVIQSGIHDEYLALCLETEAVSTLYRYVTYKYMSLTYTTDSKKSILQPGLKYLILIAGEEFSNVSVLEVLVNGNLRELHKTSGCPWGKATVIQAYIEFMKSLVGAKVLKELREKDKVEYADMITEFDSRIGTLNPERKLVVRFPSIIEELCMNSTHLTLSDTIAKNSKFSKNISVWTNIIRIDYKIIHSFFSNTCDSIIKHIMRVLHETNAKDISTILMVGRLSESPIFKEDVKQAIADKRVFALDYPGSEVLEGSAIFGHDSNSIITTNVTKNTCRGPRKF